MPGRRWQVSDLCGDTDSSFGPWGWIYPCLAGLCGPQQQTRGCHPTRSCRARWATATTPGGAQGSPNVGVGAAFELSQPTGLACTKLQPLPWPEGDGAFGMLSWAPSPPHSSSICTNPSLCPPHPTSLQHPSPGTGVSLVPAVARHCHQLQPGVGITHLKVRRSFGVSSVLSPSSAFPPVRSLHQQENCLFLTLIKP